MRFSTGLLLILLIFSCNDSGKWHEKAEKLQKERDSLQFVCDSLQSERDSKNIKVDSTTQETE